MTEFRLRRADSAAALGLVLVILGPVIVQGGYVLRGDMVFTPNQPWKSAWLGLDGGVPRSVPMDAFVWLFEQALPGDIVQKVFLVGSFLLLALGVARLLSSLHCTGRIAAMIFACWNPWVYERLAIGQWPCVLGLAALPWLVAALVRRREAAAAAWLLVAAVAAPSLGLTAVLVAVTVVATLRATRADWLVLSVSCVAANLPWVVPSLLRSGLRAPSGQFAGFAATGESGAGSLASVLSLGGIWKTSVVPTERTSAALVVLAVLVTLASLAFFWQRRQIVPAHRGLLIAAGLSLVLGIAIFTSPLDQLAQSVPAVGILRDSTRYLAPFVLVVALGFGLLVDEVVSHAKSAVVLAAVPVALLPSMAWGLHGFLEPTQYPSSWFQARAVLEQQGAGTTVVLPWRGSYRGYPWTAGHAVLDPAPRFFPGDVLTDDRTFLSSRVVASEDPYLTRVGTALSSTDAAGGLRALGVRWVLIERGPRLASGPVPHGRVAFASADLTLLDLGSAARSERAKPGVGWVLAADLTTIFPFFLVFLRRRVTGVTFRSN